MSERVAYMSDAELQHHVRISHHLDRPMSAEEHQALHDHRVPAHYHNTDDEGRVTKGSYQIGGCAYCGLNHSHRVNCSTAQARLDGVDEYHPEGSVVDPSTGMAWGEWRIVPRATMPRNRAVR